MNNAKNMTDAELTQYLIETSAVPESAKPAYAAGYFEGTILSLMARFPEVRKEIEDRAALRMNETEVSEYKERAARQVAF
jgi:hypothetical protein